MGAPAAPAMRWASASSHEEDAVAAARAAGAAARAALGEGPVDLALVFFGASHVPSAAALAGALRDALAPACLAGASAHGVVADDREIESGPCVSVLAARLPGVAVAPFVILNEPWIGAARDADALAAAAPGTEGAELVLLLGDPFSLDAERVLLAFDRHRRGTRIVGGLASAAGRPGGNALLLNDWVSAEGGIGIGLSGALRADVVVSQGCRPIGPPLEVTRASQNVLIELDGQPALERAEQVLRALDDAGRERLRHGLYVGRPVRDDAEGPGDYLIRNLLGADRDRGLLAMADVAREHERIRLHVRDAETAREDLELRLAPQEFDVRASAALLFSCNGRGVAFHGRPDGDSGPLQRALGGAVPAAGMFCAGEIGPVGGRHYVHGHTASIAIVRPPAPARG
uniref:Histidine kinase n=1 Tax=Eiseniibacteriota bacterium TaxID=2212470 RepID=A0A832MN96_UNCEI